MRQPDTARGEDHHHTRRRELQIILTGDVRQIDTPYLDEQSNGLSYVIDRLRGKDLYAHITPEKGERSDLANLANTFL